MIDKHLLATQFHRFMSLRDDLEKKVVGPSDQAHLHTLETKGWFGRPKMAISKYEFQSIMTSTLGVR